MQSIPPIPNSKMVDLYSNFRKGNTVSICIELDYQQKSSKTLYKYSFQVLAIKAKLGI